VKHESLSAAAGRAAIVEACFLANGGPVTSVAICDDRPSVRQSLSEMLLPLRSLLTLDSVADGFALIDVCDAVIVDIVLIGVHNDSTTGQHAFDLLLGLRPETPVIVIGAATDVDMLAEITARGARGLLIWDEPEDSGAGTQDNGPLVW
jgi:DNA-binding NtrC family response regulator